MTDFKFQFSKAKLRGGIIRKCATIVSNCHQREKHLYAFCLLGVCLFSWWGEWVDNA